LQPLLTTRMAIHTGAARIDLSRRTFIAALTLHCADQPALKKEPARRIGSDGEAGSAMHVVEEGVLSIGGSGCRWIADCRAVVSVEADTGFG
jgi:hypothetical protein